MTHLLGLCFDTPGSPTIRLASASDKDGTNQPCGLGMAWYPEGDTDAAVVKDPATTRAELVTRMLSEWRRFRSTVFLAHFLQSGGRRTQQDTHPFRRSHAGRGWMLAHHGNLGKGLAQHLPLGEDPIFEPLGKTDSEHAFCWLMARIRGADARRLADVGFPQLHEWLRQINEGGTANLLISDGLDVVAYRDLAGQGGLCWARRTPPHAELELGNSVFDVDLSDVTNLNRSLVVFSSEKMAEDGFRELDCGQMLVARRGAVIHDSGSEVCQLPPPAARAPRSSAPPILTPEGRLVLTPVAASQAQTQAQAQGTAPSTEAGAVGRWLETEHETIYRYEHPVERSEHILRLQPVHDLGQQLARREILVDPAGEFSEFEDVFGNASRHHLLRHPYDRLHLRARCRVFVTAPAPLGSLPVRRPSMPAMWMPWQREMMHPYLLPTELPEAQLRELTDYAMSFVERQDHDLIDTLLDINQGIHADFAYLPGSTHLKTTPFEVFTARQGVCQDFANLMICLARLLNVPARYRVGYIFTGNQYDNPEQGDASHAWAELFVPGVGWRGFDPTNGCEVGLDHVRVACGRNYGDATPTSGTIFDGGGGETLQIRVQVSEVDGPGDPAP